MNNRSARRLTQGLFLGVLLCIPLRGLCLDIPHQRFIFFWIPLTVQYFLIPALALLAFFLTILGLAFLKGRMFCTWLCPMHAYLEVINSSRRRHRSRIKVTILAVLGSLWAVEIPASFLWPLSRQIVLLQNPTVRWPVLAITGTLAGLIFLLLFHFKEVFCIRACPYGLIQMVLQGPTSRQMRFNDPENTCIHCGLCHNICPMNLDAKKECDSLRCTGCGLCVEACTSVLGPDRGLFKSGPVGESEA